MIKIIFIFCFLFKISLLLAQECPDGGFLIEFDSVSTNQKINFVFGNRRPGDVEKVFASVEKAKNVLKWKAELTIEQALIDAWNWQKNLPTHSK